MYLLCKIRGESKEHDLRIRPLGPCCTNALYNEGGNFKIFCVHQLLLVSRGTMNSYIRQLPIFKILEKEMICI